MRKDDRLVIDIIISIIEKLYGYDFKNYSQASFIRRLEVHRNKLGLETLADIIPLLINHPDGFNDLLSDISITVTEFLRDPLFYNAFAKKVIPVLKTYPYIKIWHAGCATGEEVYSMAFLLAANKFLSKTMLYGTDFNKPALAIAKKGIYPKNKVLASKKSFSKVFPTSDFNDFFTEKYDAMKTKNVFNQHVTFSHHNLATDNSFIEIEVIICRNVLIYFESELRDRALSLFYNSLCPQGFLCLGVKESLEGSKFSSRFDCIDRELSIYRKKR